MYIDYIDFDDSELLYSDFDDATLQMIANIMGPDIRDKLLVPVVENVRSNSRVVRSVI